MADDVDPWDRQPGESARAYAAFARYRDLGADRSVRRVAEDVGKARRLIERWSADWTWVVRVEAWDREQERMWRAQVAQRRRDMALRHARIAGAMQAKLVDRLQRINPDELTARDLANWLQVAAQVERQALGEPDRVEVSGPAGGPVETADVSGMTPEERMARLDQLRREMERRIGAAQT